MGINGPEDSECKTRESTLSVIQKLSNLDFHWLGKQLSLARRQAGLSLEEAAIQIGMSKTSLHRMEYAKAIPDYSAVLRALVWLGVDEKEIKVKPELADAEFELVAKIEELIDDDPILRAREKFRLKMLFRVICENL